MVPATLRQPRGGPVPEILMQLDVAAGQEAVWEALTTHQGITSWWTTRAEVPEGQGAVLKLSFPDAPITWDLRVDQARQPQRLVWHCVGGPPQWVDTEVAFALSPAAQGDATTVRFDHVGWREADQMFRVVTFGWGQMLSRLKGFLDSGKAMPYFDF
jgi:uncharacterized protein YndB with AHSA1/START domain